MKALTYMKPGEFSLIDKEKPRIIEPTDVIVRMSATTICGTDLHILSGDVPEVPYKSTLGHEGVGIVDEVGSSVTNFKTGDRVLVSCITACNKCYYCKRNLPAHCEKGGWILGHLIDGTQAEYVRIPQADGSLYHVPNTLDDGALVMLSDILPTGYEIGVKQSQIKPGCTVAIVGAGPIGIASLLTSQFYSPSKIIMIDINENRLEVSKKFGATHTIISDSLEHVKREVDRITEGLGVDIVMECVGYPATFDICQEIIGIGGHISNVGVHGKSVPFNLDKLWIKNISLSTGLVNGNTTEMLLDVIESGKINPKQLITHHFKLSQIEKAYDVFKNAVENQTLKVIIENDLTL